MFPHRYFGARYFGPRYFGSIDAENLVFVSDNLGAGAGHHKKPYWPPPELYFPPVKDAAEIAEERKRRVRFLRNIKKRQESIRQAEESRRLLAILKGEGRRFGQRFEAAIDLLGGKHKVLATTQGSTDLAGILADLLDEDEESAYERAVPRSIIAKHMAELWMEDPERFEQFWNRMRN